MPAASLRLNSIWGAMLLFTGVYAFAYLPYFLFAPLPDVQQDSYIYFWAASLIRDGIVPLPKFPVDVPVGYPVFVWLIKSITGKTGSIIVVQNLLFVAASVYAIACFGKIKKPYAWLAAIALSLYSIDNFTMRINTWLYSECLYTALLIFVAARLAVFFSAKTPVSLGLLIGSLLLPCLVRPNGIYVFFLVPLLAIYIWVKGYPVIHRYTLAVALLLVLLLWSGVNYTFKGIFLPTEPYRIAAILKRDHKARPVNTGNKAPGKNNTPKTQLLAENLGSIAESKPSFYFTFIPDRYEYLYEKPLYADPDEELFDRYRVDSVAPALKGYLFAEFMDSLAAPVAVKTLCNLQSTQKSKWMLVNHVMYRLYDVLVWNVLWVVAFCIAGVWLLFNLLRAPKANEELYLLFSLFCMHFVSVLVVSIGHNRFQTRYPHVTEVFMLLTVLLSIYYIVTARFQKTQ